MPDFSKTLQAVDAALEKPSFAGEPLYEEFALDEVEYLRSPKVIVLRNVFGKERNQKIIDEALSLEEHFGEGKVGEGNVMKHIRSNRQANYDMLYSMKRSDSPLLRIVNDLIGEAAFRNLVQSAGGSLGDIGKADVFETQVGRYGDLHQKYEWHVDRHATGEFEYRRNLTFVYYFFKEPKQFEGGSIKMSDGVLANGGIIGAENEHEIQIENDMGLVFEATTPHMVMPTTSPADFDAGRFSANVWIGNRKV